MLSDDQKKVGTTAIAVIIGGAMAWYFLVDHNPPKTQPQLAQQLKRGDFKDRKQPVRIAQSNEGQPEARPLPPPVPVLKPRPRPVNSQPVESPNPKPATTTPQTDVPVEDVDPVTPQEPVVPVQLARLALGFVGA